MNLVWVKEETFPLIEVVSFTSFTEHPGLKLVPETIICTVLRLYPDVGVIALIAGLILLTVNAFVFVTLVPSVFSTVRL